MYQVQSKSFFLSLMKQKTSADNFAWYENILDRKFWADLKCCMSTWIIFKSFAALNTSFFFVFFKFSTTNL